MNIKSQLTLLLALSTGAATQVAFAQPPMQPPIVGNFRPASISDPEVKIAAHFALKAQKKSVRPTLLAIEAAQKQLVAGMNFRMTLRLKSGGKVSRAQTVIYRDLSGKYSLTSWTPLAPPKAALPKALAPKK